jgi:hypothetical protein
MMNHYIFPIKSVFKLAFIKISPALILVTDIYLLRNVLKYKYHPVSDRPPILWLNSFGFT